MSNKMRHSFKDCKETIHSGQFMVSHIEGQEDDLEEDDEGSAGITSPLGSDVIPYIEYANNTTIEKYNPCRSDGRTVTQVEIDTDLSTIFNTLNVTYRQKLTSPKWNPFKGIRLRWKDKIRLNNVIWRCWHMQFIMKKKLFVCQFASPLDVDIHNTPQAILLEGKYWKRKLGVIKAEYTKWRKYNVHRLGTTNIVDTTSELDFLEWSPNGSEKLLAISDNMTTDTLFSTLTQYPFPDSREIARAGRADFIQPSLGPLQPNLDDLMDLDLDFLNFSTRLAPVPEEAPEEILKAIDYPIMGNDPMETQNLQQQAAAAQARLQQQQQHQQQHQQNTLMNVDGSMGSTLQYTAKIYAQPIETSGGQSVIQQVGSGGGNAVQSQQQQQQQMNRIIDSYINNPAQQTSQMVTEDVANKYSNRGLIKIGRREPHNYDKVQNTPHQTNIYNQLIAQQQQLQTPMSAQQSGSVQSSGPYSPGYNTMATPIRISPIQTTTNSYTNILNLSNSSQEAMQMQTMNATALGQMQNMQRMQQQQFLGAMAGGQQPEMNAQQQDSYKMGGLQSHSPLSPSYKSYHGHQTPYKIPSQGYVASQRPRHLSPPSLEQQQQQQQLQSKEMYRSNSLPINATLQLPHKDDVFAVPKYQAKSTSSANSRLRSRSNSMIMKQSSQAGIPFQPNILQTAASEPVLNSMSSSPSPSSSSTSALLAQLLTTNNGPKLVAEQSCLVSTSNAEMKHPLAQYSSYSMPTPTVTQPPSSASLAGVQKHSKSLPQQLIGNIVPVVAVSSNLTHQSSSGSNSSTSSASSSIQMTIPKVPTPCVSPDSVIDSDTPLSPRACSSRDMRRTGHIHAEQKRRYNIKNGFDMLHSLIPQLQHSPNAKLSKAALLQKGAEYIKQLRAERATNTELMEKLRREKEALNSSLNHLHTVLPANGAPLSREKTGKIKEMYMDYVHNQTRENWKFWIFGTIFEPLMNSFNQTVSVASKDELCRTTQLWVDQHCSLVELRPAVTNKLRLLSTTTDILSDPPTTLQDEARKAIIAYEASKTT